MKGWHQGNQWIEVNCPYCHKEFKVYFSRYSQSKDKKIYCSWNHYKLDRRVIINCKVCGKEKTIYKSDLSIKDRGQFCSKRCRGRVRVGEKNWNWKGGKIKDGSGYIRVRVDGKYVMEHRLIMRVLDKPHLHVHHINAIKTDNRPENLMILTHSEHSTLENNKRWGNL